MPWRFHKNILSRSLCCQNACALATVTWVFVAFPPLAAQAQSNGMQPSPVYQGSVYQQSTYQLPAPPNLDMVQGHVQGHHAGQFAQPMPATGDLASSPWTYHNMAARNLPASNPTAAAQTSQVPVAQGQYPQGQPVATRMVSHPASELALGESTQSLPSRGQAAQAPMQPSVATLQWGAIQQAPAGSATGGAVSAGPSIAGSRDGQFYGLGAPQLAPRSVQSHQVSSSTELSLGPAYQPGAESQPPQPVRNGYNTSGSAFDASTPPEQSFSLQPSQPMPQQPTAPTHTQISVIQPSVPDPRWEAEQTQLQQRRELAERVSNDILSTAPSHRPTSVRPLESPAGWSSVEQDLRVHMDKCEQLLRRNAIHSGREEISLGLRRLTRMLDAVSGTAKCEPALDSALNALREEAEFQRAEGIVSIQDLVSSHSTPALKNSNLSGVTAETASQHYRHFARQQMVAASEQHPWAADLLYAYGKTLEKEADATFESSVRLRSQAVICYQAALQVRQGHPSASAQLGYSLLKLDRLDEAQQTLSMAVQHSPNTSNWSNLAEVHRRRGAMQQAHYALAQAAQYGGPAQSQFTSENPEVTQINPAEFAKYSPAHNMAAPVSTSIQQTTKPVEPVKTANIFSNLFR